MADRFSNDECEILGSKTGVGRKRYLRSSTTAKKAVKTEPEVKYESPVAEKGKNQSEERPIIFELRIDREFFSAHKLEKINEVLDRQQWGHLFQDKVRVNEDSIRDFYRYFTVTEKAGLFMANFVFDGKMFNLSDVELGKILEVPVEGSYEYVKGTWPTDVSKDEVMTRVIENPKYADKTGNALGLGIVNRTLHRLLCMNIIPRLQKYVTVYFQDFLLLDKLTRKNPISLPKLMLSHMKHAVESPGHGLPYPGTVKKILEHFDLYQEDSEVVYTTTLSMESYEKWGWKYTASKGWRNGKWSDFDYNESEAESEEKVPIKKGSITHSSVVAGVLTKLMARMDAMDAKLDKLVEVQKKYQGTPDESILDLLKEQKAALEKLPSLIHEVDISAGMGITHTMQVKDQIIELNQQLKFISTRVLDQLSAVFQEKVQEEPSARSRSSRR